MGVVEDLVRTNEVDLSIFNDPDVGLEVTHPSLVALLAKVERQWWLQPHCIEYAVSLFWGGTSEPMEDFAVEALTECCLNFPLKLRGHGLDGWSSLSIKDTNDDDGQWTFTMYKTRIDPGVIQYPISPEERIRRINSLWIDLVQTRYQNLLPRLLSAWGVSEETPTDVNYIDRRLFPPIPSALMKWDRVKRRRRETIESSLTNEDIERYLEPVANRAEIVGLPESDLALIVNCLTKEQIQWLNEQPHFDSAEIMMKEAGQAVRDITYGDVVPDRNPDFLRVDFVPDKGLKIAIDNGLVHAKEGSLIAVGYTPSELETEETKFVSEVLERRKAERKQLRKQRRKQQPSIKSHRHRESMSSQDEVVSLIEPESDSTSFDEPRHKQQLRSDESDFSGSGHRYRLRRSQIKSSSDRHSREGDWPQVAKALPRSASREHKAFLRQEQSSDDEVTMRTRKNRTSSDSFYGSEVSEAEAPRLTKSRKPRKDSGVSSKKSKHGLRKPQEPNTFSEFLVSGYISPPLAPERVQEFKKVLEENEFTLQELVTYDWTDIEPIFVRMPRAPVLRFKKALAKYAKHLNV